MQTTSLELSKRLFEKSVKKMSYFVHDLWADRVVKRNSYPLHGLGTSYLPAYTLCELLGIISKVRFNKGCVAKISTTPYETSLWGYNDAEGLSNCLFRKRHIDGRLTPTEITGLILEWLIDNGHVNVEEINAS
jgi:hypothetical protein